VSTDTTVSGWSFVVDEDNMASNSATKLPTQQSVKAYVDAQVNSALASEMTYRGGYNASTDTPALDTGSPVISVGDLYVVTVAGTFFTTSVSPGDLLIANTTSSGVAFEGNWDIVETSMTIPTASPTVPGIAEIALQSEVNTGTDYTRIVTPLTLASAVLDGGSF